MNPAARREKCLNLQKAILEKKIPEGLRIAITGPDKEKADTLRTQNTYYAEATVAPWFDEKPELEVPMAVAQKLPKQIQLYLPAEQKRALQVGERQHTPTVKPRQTSLTSHHQGAAAAAVPAPKTALSAPNTNKKEGGKASNKRKSPSSVDEKKGTGKAAKRPQGPGQGKSANRDKPEGRPKGSTYKFSHVSPTTGKKRFMRTDVNAKGAQIFSSDEPGGDQKSKLEEQLEDMQEQLDLTSNQNHDLMAKNETLTRLALQWHKEQLTYMQRLKDYAASQIKVIQILSKDYQADPLPDAPATPVWLVAAEEKANRQVAETLDLSI